MMPRIPIDFTIWRSWISRPLRDGRDPGKISPQIRVRGEPILFRSGQMLRRVLAEGNQRIRSDQAFRTTVS